MTSLILPIILFIHVKASRLPLAEDTTDLQQTSAEEKTNEAVNSETRRAMWLSTRQLDPEFKDLIFATLLELSKEGRIDDRVIAPASRQKRGRYQGFCFQKTASGRYLPYICWKGDRK